jgi:hypothetical protein
MVHRGPPPFKIPARFQTWGSAGFKLHRFTSAASSRPPPRPALNVLACSAALGSTHNQGLTLVHFSAYREHFFGIRWVASWSFADKTAQVELKS